MSMKSVISAVMLLSTMVVPALADDYWNTPARADPPRPEQRPLFGGAVAGPSGSTYGAGAVATARKDASNAANAVTRTDALSDSSVPPFSTNPHMYDYLSGPEYRGGE
jgi:hypothetical protein